MSVHSRLDSATKSTARVYTADDLCTILEETFHLQPGTTRSAGHESKTSIKIRCNQRCQHRDEMVQPKAQHVSILRTAFAQPHRGRSTYILAATRSAGHTSKASIKIRCNQRCQQTDEMVQPKAQHVFTLRKSFAQSRRRRSTYILAATQSAGHTSKTSIKIRCTNVSKQIRWCNQKHSTWLHCGRPLYSPAGGVLRTPWQPSDQTDMRAKHRLK